METVIILKNWIVYASVTIIKNHYKSFLVTFITKIVLFADYFALKMNVSIQLEMASVLFYAFLLKRSIRHYICVFASFMKAFKENKAVHFVCERKILKFHTVTFNILVLSYVLINHALFKFRKGSHIFSILRTPINGN